VVQHVLTRTCVKASFTSGCPLLPSDEVIISDAAEKFDAQGRLSDNAIRTFLAGFLQDFEHWVGLHAAHKEEPS
tara:strand:+ start:5850 stop:6071 length:222 start_codon:yes stop_codon:yes gene_type:complete